MRVLFLHAALNGLTAEYNVHTTLATHARSAGVEPYFIWQSPVHIDWIDTDRSIAHDFGRNMSILPKPSRYRRASMIMRRLPQTWSFLMSMVQQIQPDVIYTSQQSFDVRLASLLANRLHIPHVIHIHYSVGPWLGKYTLNTIQKSSRLIAVSEYIRQTALLQGVLPPAIHTVVNPMPAAHAQPHKAHCAIRAEFSIEANAPLVVAAGRLDPGKGHLALFEAFARVIQQMPNARLLLCGSSTSRDNYEGRLRARVHELQLDPYTIFAGQRNDLPAILRAANLFCLPSELEPFGLVFLEAMAAGLPVVACYSGGVPEIVMHNQTGLLSYPDDVQSLAANLLLVLVDSALAQRLGNAGKQRAATAFAPARVAARWLNVLEQKLG